MAEPVQELSLSVLNNIITNNKKPNQNYLNLLLSVLACPLVPVSPLPKPHFQASPQAQYIMQHFTGATGCRRLEGTVRNTYATGKVTMDVVDDLGSNNGTSSLVGASVGSVSQTGCFVMWQMVPNKWLIELVVGGHKVVAGSDGVLAWRHTPWLGSHAAKGGVRPLRRALQGLDPVAISAMFSLAQYMGEKSISDIDCFVLRLSADDVDLADRSDSSAEMIKHVMFGYFSQRNGLLVHLEDSYLTRIQSPGSYPTYWETFMTSEIENYQTIEGVMIAHSGRSSVSITRFGDNFMTGPAITRMEEVWTIDDVAFNVPGLSIDCFIPPEELHEHYPKENLDWRSSVH